MFTGIIEEIGTVRVVKPGQRSASLEINALKVLEGTKIGDSISVNGVCLTVTSINHTSFTSDVMPETMQYSTLGSMKSGSKINLERALCLGDRLGGHLVSGHIDGTGIILNFTEDDNAIRVKIGAGKALLRYIILKGSVAVEGVSLTVTKTTDEWFEVSVIPHTRNQTILCSQKPGEKVNIECDMTGKYIEQFAKLNSEAGVEKKDISKQFLEENGFL